MFRILILDANTPFRQSLKKILANKFPAVEIEEAAQKQKGLAKLQTFAPHLVFLDIHLPGASGLDLARRIKKEHPDIIVIILTSYDTPEYQAAAKQSGIEYLVPKDDWTGKDIITLVESIFKDLDSNRPCEEKKKKAP